MKVSTALFASILCICLTASYVSGQIRFADDTVQTTAFHPATVPSGQAYSFYKSLVFDESISATVPVDQELVILQVTLGYNGNFDPLILESVLPNLTNPVALAGISPPYRDGEGNRSVHHFPDGTVVVDEGRQLYVNATNAFFAADDATVLGYFRNK